MSGKVKFRKCHECGDKMVVRKSKKYNEKFWACTQYPDCSGSAEYHGIYAVSGVNIDVREIENGYVVRAQQKYPDDAADDDPQDTYCGTTIEELREKLGEIFDVQIGLLIDKIQSCDQFDVEPDPKVKKSRSKKAADGETDINTLLKKVKASRERQKKQMANPDD